MRARNSSRLIVVCMMMVGVWTSVCAQGQEKRMSLDVKDTDIRDAIRMVSKAYDLSIILDNDVTGTVTLHLSDVPIMEGLRSLAESQGLEVTKEGSVYRIRMKTDEEHASIRYLRGKLTVDVQNVDVHEFLKELSSKTAVSIVPDNKVSGRITGKLYDVNLDDGIRAILEGNGFEVVRRRNIYQVSKEDNEPATARSRSRRIHRGGTASDFFVDYSNDKLTIDVSNGNLEDVLNAISEQTDVQIVTYGSIKAEVNAKLFDMDLTDAFALLLGGTQYTFVEKNGIILIGDRNAATPAGQALSKSELIHLKHIKADEVPAILPKNISANNVKVVKEQNALLISGTSEDIVKSREFLATIDIPTPQVRIDAVIVEYKKNFGRSFNMRFWRSRNDRLDDYYRILPGESNSASFELGSSGKSFKDFLGITNGILGKIPDDFFLILQWLEEEDKAKILAQPSVVTLNGRKASISVDETQYFKVPTIVANVEQTVERIQPIKFGISLDITPWISQGGQITAEISPVVSNSDGVSGDNLPNVSSRSLNTTVRLEDGETLALGGLIKENSSSGGQKVPLLADLPLIGTLFRTNRRSQSKTNLVVYITPHVIDQSDTVNLSKELRDYDLYLLNDLERKAFTGVRELKERRRQIRERRAREERRQTETQSVIEAPKEKATDQDERRSRRERRSRDDAPQPEARVEPAEADGDAAE